MDGSYDKVLLAKDSRGPLRLLVLTYSQEAFDIFLDKYDLESHPQILLALALSPPNGLDFGNQLLLPFLECVFNGKQSLGVTNKNFGSENENKILVIRDYQGHAMRVSKTMLS